PSERTTMDHTNDASGFIRTASPSSTTPRGAYFQTRPGTPRGTSSASPVATGARMTRQRVTGPDASALGDSTHATDDADRARWVTCVAVSMARSTMPPPSERSTIRDPAGYSPVG